MFIEAKLVLQSYMPDKLEKGMWFMGLRKKIPIVYELTHDILNQQEQSNYIELNGFPVQPFIYLIGNPNITDDDDLFCTPEQIGWFDEGDNSEDLSDITIKEINNILEYDDGMIYIDAEIVETSEESDEQPEEAIVPYIMEGKCIVRYHGNDEEEDDDDDEYDDICSSCNGSGEGMWDGSTCRVCGGSGDSRPPKHWDEDYDD